MPRIWNKAKHSALTDLIFFNGYWLLSFREGAMHVGGKNGQIRILRSKDGKKWRSYALLKKKGVDLRDPKLSITPDGRLMILVGGIEKKTYRSMVAFSNTDAKWTPIQRILKDHLWLWRITWLGKIGYGAAYNTTKTGKKTVLLFSTEDGIKYKKITEWKLPPKPSETTLRFDAKGNMIALVRRDSKKDNSAYIGFAKPPYKNWTFKNGKSHVGGPNFLILPNGKMIAAGRVLIRTSYGYFEKTAIFSMTGSKLSPKIYLPSGGPDCSYPGMVYRGGYLWISYYSSHEKRCSIYFEKIKIRLN